MNLVSYYLGRKADISNRQQSSAPIKERLYSILEQDYAEIVKDSIEQDFAEAKLEASTTFEERFNRYIKEISNGKK